MYGSPSELFGELLSRLVPLSGHDVEEVLEEQAGSHRRFGEIALAWGLCQPMDIWQAWGTQLVGRTPTVDLHLIGIDAQATAYLSGAIAAILGVIPVRVVGDTLVIAADERTIAVAAQHLPSRLTKAISFVLADPAQIQEAIRNQYPSAARRLMRATCDRQQCTGSCAAKSCASALRVSA